MVGVQLIGAVAQAEPLERVGDLAAYPQLGGVNLGIYRSVVAGLPPAPLFAAGPLSAEAADKSLSLQPLSRELEAIPAMDRPLSCRNWRRLTGCFMSFQTRRFRLAEHSEQTHGRPVNKASD